VATAPDGTHAPVASSPAGGEAGEFRDATLARFERHRQAWQQNPALRALYTRWYQEISARLPAREFGRWVELGSGPGFARDVIPGLELSDIVRAPWHDLEIDAEALPFADGELGALVLFDVLHHLPRPARFFAEAVRVLRPGGGRLVWCEPYVSPLSFPIYRFFHEERCDLSVDPLGDVAHSGDDPFDGNQAIPSLLLGRYRADLERRFPALRVAEVRRLAGPSYPASGGFSRGPLLPMRLWRGLAAVESWLPEAAFRLLGFRVLAVLERR
jgi:SAM-dependent methyltransferase